MAVDDNIEITTTTTACAAVADQELRRLPRSSKRREWDHSCRDQSDDDNSEQELAEEDAVWMINDQSNPEYRRGDALFQSQKCQEY